MTSFYWDSGPLLAAAAASYRLGLTEAAAFARSRAKWRHVQASIHPGIDGVVVGSPLARLEEGGAVPHTIDPAGGGPARVLKFKTGGFAAGPVHHPGFKGDPFMRETEDAWPAIYTAAARRSFG